MTDATVAIETFSIKRALIWGWERFRGQPWFFIGVALIVFVISAVLGAFSDDNLVGDALVRTFLGLAATVVQWWLYIGIIGILLAAYDKKPLAVHQLFEQSGRTLWHYALGTILYGLIIIGGLILLVIPGLVWAIKFHYYSYLIVDRDFHPVAALKESARVTMGYKWTIFSFFLVLGLLNLAGALVFGVGLLVSIPVTLLASVWVYKWLAEHENTAPVEN